MSSYAFTCGDINGIGPEIVLKTINSITPSPKRRVIFVCPQNIFKNTAKFVTPNFRYNFYKSLPDILPKDEVIILDIGIFKQNYGKSTSESGSCSYNSINIACELSKQGIVESVITAPISKHAFKKANIDFPGHTELLAEYFNVKKYSMMFVSNKMKAALMTIHIPIKDVHKNLTKDVLGDSINVIKSSLQKDFKIANPKIAVLGLNPHAGENGYIGKEEEEIIKPVLKNRKDVFGPFVPDAYFGNKDFRNYDCTIGMYHDQVLIPFKLLNFNSGVNYTAGLPIVRTSPDHGTAFDIAGKGIANPGSMIEAFKVASKITKNRSTV